MVNEPLRRPANFWEGVPLGGEWLTGYDLFLVAGSDPPKNSPMPMSSWGDTTMNICDLNKLKHSGPSQSQLEISNLHIRTSKVN